MTKTEFNILLGHSSKSAFDFAKIFINDELPIDFKYIVKLNCSKDDPSLTQFEMYPNDNDKIMKLISEIEVVDLLCRNGKVPVWIDISVDSVYKKNTVFQLICAGRYSDNENEFYSVKQKTGPFGIKSPVLPPDFKDGNKFTLRKKRNIINWLLNN